MKHWVYILIALWGWGLARVSLAEKNAPVTFTMQSLEPGQRDELVRYETGAGGKWSGSCEGSVEETWSGISYYSPSNCTGDYQTRASRVGARPGFRFDKFFLFRALISHRQMNIMSSGGNCPSSETYNFLLLRGRNKGDYVLPMDYSSTSTFAAGTFTYDSSNITGVSRFSLESLSPVLNSIDDFSYEPVSDTCASGALVSKASDFTDMPLGKYPSWVFGDSLAVSIEGGTNPIMTVAVPQSALSTASSFWANKNKNVYTGLMTHFTGRGSQEQKNIYLTPSDENGRVFSLSEASGTGALNDTSLRASLGSINCSNLNSPSPGFCSGTLAFTGSDNTGNAVCLFSFDNNGKDLLFCAAQSPSDNSRLITFLAGTSAVTKLEVQASPLHLSANQESGVVNVTVTNLTSRPALSLNPDSLLGSEKLLAPFTPLTNASLTGSFTPGGFVTGNTCGAYLPAYSTCQIQIAYAPAAPGLHKQVFRLPYDKKQSISQNAITQILASRGLSSLQIVAPDFTVGGAASAQVIATYGEGETQQTQDVTALVNCNADIGCIPIVEGYSTSNNQAILVSSSGTLTSSQAGSATITARAGSFTASTTVTAFAGAPEPINVTATATNYSQIDLSWTSGGEGTSAFQIAYQAGETAPATCSIGTVITAATQGLATTKSILGLTANTQYSFRVCATNGAGTITTGVTASATTPIGIAMCSGDCYADSDATTAGSALGPGDVEMEYVFANGSSGFKIWIEKGGSRILNATGLIANGWQKELTRAGTAFSGTDFTMGSHIAGRVCPTHVFLSHSNMTATGRCLYYDGGNVAQALDAAGTSGTEASDWLQDWSLPATGPAESGTSSSYYEGNISTCAEKGMRLPTMYETTMTKPGDYLPIGDGIDSWDITGATHNNEPLSVANEEATPNGVFFKPDGTKMYVIGHTGDDVNEYTLSSAWDASTASYVQSFSVASEEAAPRGLFFKSDGTKMYVIGNTQYVDEVNEYTLSSAWDVSSASYVQNFSVRGEETAPNGIFFNPDGTKMYVIGHTGDDVNEYTLSSAWDISSASYLQNFSVASEEAAPNSIFFKPDGTKMYVMGHNGDDVNEYNLSSAWDISSASYVQNFSVASEEVTPTGLFFKPDGTKMYVIGHGQKRVIQYDLLSGHGKTAPLWAGSTQGVPSYSSQTWTASANTSSTNHYWEWDGESSTYKNYSTLSSVRCVLPDNTPDPPNVPTAVTGSIGNARVVLTWTAPTSDGGSAITDYVIEYSSDNGNTWTSFADSVSASKSSTVTGLTNGTAYIFRVAAVNAAGTSIYSLNSPRFTPVNTPGAPTGVVGTAGCRQVSLTWTAPTSDGGSAITDYVIQYSSNNGSTWTTFADSTSTSRSATVTGLSNDGTAYIFRVAAVNAAGTGSNSQNSSSVTLAPPPPITCSGSCYTGADSLCVGTEAPGPDGTTLTLQYANGASGFTIWKEKGGSRILNATGLVANGWQKKLTEAGTAFSATDFTDASQVAGRVCPTHVFLSHSNMTATGRCLYYDSGNAAQRLDAAGTSGTTEASDWLQYWNRAATGRNNGADSTAPAGSSYFEGNIKTCADKGMRLPTMYETTMTQRDNNLPTGDGITPTWAEANGVPRVGSYTWTASANASDTTSYWIWSGTSSITFGYSFFQSVRCVLP